MNFRQKHGVFMKVGGRCFYCGTDLLKTSWDIEHVHPKAQGGSNDVDNLVAACTSCNRSKGKCTPDEFRNILISRVLRRLEEAYDHCHKLSRYCVDLDKLDSALTSIDEASNAIDGIRVRFYGEPEEPDETNGPRS